MRYSKFDDDSKDLIVIQAKDKEALLNRLIDMSDASHIVEKTKVFEIIIQREKVKNLPLNHINQDDISSFPYLFNLNNVHDKAFHVKDPDWDNFDLVDYMKDVLGYKPYHMKHATHHFLIKSYQEEYGESLVTSFYGSNLHQTMIKQLVCEQYSSHFINDDEFREQSSVRTMVTMLGQWIGPHRLHHFVSLPYETAKLIFFQKR